MELKVTTLEGKEAGSVQLSDAIFGLEPRADILHRMVRWQLAKRQAGTHATLGKSDVSYSTKKIYRQKGTGGARHGSRKAPIFGASQMIVRSTLPITKPVSPASLTACSTNRAEGAPRH